MEKGIERSVNGYSTIGDLVRTSLKQYQMKGRKSSFKEIAAASFSVHDMAEQGQSDPVEFMEIEEFWNFLKGIPAGPVSQERGSESRKRELPDFVGNFYIQESEMFKDMEDITMYIHIPYVNDGLHSHDHFEINYVYHGTGFFEFEQEEKELKEGTLWLLAPDSPHNVMAEEDTIILTIMVRRTTFDRAFFPLLKRDDSLTSFFKNAIYELEYPNYLLYETDNSLELRRYFQSLFVEYVRNDSYCNGNVICILSLIFSVVLRNNQKPTVFFDFSNKKSNRINFPVLMQYIQQNYRSVTLKNLSDEFHYSESFFSRLIRQKLGTSFSELVMELKLMHGKELLEDGRYTIGEICDRIGYESPNHFSRVFKKVYGESPKSYKERQ